MGDSYRIKTELGINKSINIQLDQEFEFLEILSLKIQQTVEIYDKYYRFTSRTNDSGDYMIMGVPLGDQTVVMDVDLSDIGEFSLTPQDLIRMGLATEGQVAGNKFRTSNDLNSLPQLISLNKNAEISPLWGDPEICQISINRLDFDLRDDANVDIQPTAVFMGSMFSSPDNMRVRSNCRPKDDMGNLCGLTSSPGQILAIRQTIQQDEDGNPVLEVHELEQAGNIIDGSGTWLTELPMNLDYFITNEFGEKVLSNDPTVGIPTKAKYRFKVKWTQPNDLTLQTRRAYYLVPNVKEYGWSAPDKGPDTTAKLQQQESSYYFGLAWSGYTNGFGTKTTDRLNEVIDCEDTFYQFQFNRVYTVSSLIDQFKKGAKGRFIGIKEIDDNDCESTINKFPVNDGFRNFDLLFFLFSIIFTVLQPVGLILLGVAHILLWLYNLVLGFLCWLSGIGIGSPINWYPFKRWRKYCEERDYTIRLPMITYPECQACDCKQETATKKTAPESNGAGTLSLLSLPSYYNDALASTYFSGDTDNGSTWSTLFSESFAGLAITSVVSDPTRYKLPFSQQLDIPSGGARFVTSFDLPIGERINVFNQRSSYFSDQNKIKVTFAKESNVGKFHYDNTITVLSQEQFNAGDLLTFVNLTATTDTNYLYSAVTSGNTITGISGQTYNGTGATQIDVSYAVSQTSNILTPVRYNLPYGSGETNYKFPADVEYYQVITALTVSQASQIWNTGTTQSFGNILNSESTSIPWRRLALQWIIDGAPIKFNAFKYFESAQEQYVLVLQRGVDPYSPKYINEYCLGKIFGTNESDPNWIVTASTRVNIPIQKLNVSNMSVQPYNQTNMYYQSYFFKPGTTTSQIAGQSFTGFTTTNTGYYGSIDATTTPIPVGSTTVGSTVSNPGTLGLARRIRQSTIPYTTSSAACGDSMASTDSLFVSIAPQYSSPAVGIRLFEDYTQGWNIGFSNPFNGQNKWWKMNWNASLYAVQVSPSGYVTAFISCSSQLSIPTLISTTTNAFWDLNQSSVQYDNSEDLSGAAVMKANNVGIRPVQFANITYYDTSIQYNYVAALGYNYTTKTFYGNTPPMTISDSTRNVLRTDRLPSSDGLDGGAWTNNPALLQQNINFNVYLLNTDETDISSQAFTTGAEIPTADIEGLPNQLTVLSTFDCENMVGLTCYTGFGDNFEVNQDCTTRDAVEKGCYMFMRRPLTDLGKDWDNFAEWGFRFRFMYGLCRGVLSQSFMNNWINGALYMFPIQVDTLYNSQNKVSERRFCSEVVYLNNDSNNFYYRSTPYNDDTNKFVGQVADQPGAVNAVNLLYPTTIVNLGLKDYFYSEITFDPTTKGYIIPNINPTSYGDTSDLINFFVISRITDEGFLRQLIPLGDNSLDQLFSRPSKRIDGDLAQLMSINSEIGNVNFSPEYYSNIPGQTNQPSTILGTSKYPIMAVWFSSTTEDLQVKDYLTPGRINFRGSNNVGYYPYPYGIKSQVVPFYQWQLSNINTIFGNEENNWATSVGDIVQNTRFQSLDRFASNTPYFYSNNSSSNDLNARGYIFNVSGVVGNGGTYLRNGATKSKFLVGAPFQFYFGTIKGETALDKFKTKYSVDE